MKPLDMSPPDAQASATAPSSQQAGTKPTSTDDRVRGEIAALHGLDLTQLRAVWQKLYRTAAPRGFRRELLIRACAYQIQVAGYRGLSNKTRRTLLKIAAQAEQGTFTTTGMPRHLRPGTRLIRAYSGRTHVVEVVADGFAWNGQSYRSLSAIAKAISGTNWNGNVFFGLTRSKKGSPAGKSEAVDA